MQTQTFGVNWDGKWNEIEPGVYDAMSFKTAAQEKAEEDAKPPKGLQVHELPGGETPKKDGMEIHELTREKIRAMSEGKQNDAQVHPEPVDGPSHEDGPHAHLYDASMSADHAMSTNVTHSIPLRTLENTTSMGGNFLQLGESIQMSGRQVSELRNHHTRIQSYRERLRHHERTNGYIHLDNIGDSQYVGELGVGTVFSSPHQSTEGDDIDPPQSYINVVFDTGSTNLWIASALCESQGCKSRAQFDKEKSNTFYYVGQKDPSLAKDDPTQPKSEDYPIMLDITFGTGELKGPMGVDDFHVGPFVVQKQTFALVEDEVGSVFDAIRFEGILGLAFPSMSAHNVKPFFDNVIEQEVLTSNEFSFFFTKLPTQASAIFFGGVDNRFFYPPIKMFPVVEQHYWTIHLESMFLGDEQINIVNGKPVNRMILDTGTTYFTAPAGVINKVLRLAPSQPCSNVGTDFTMRLNFTLRDRSGHLQRYSYFIQNYFLK